MSRRNTSVHYFISTIALKIHCISVLTKQFRSDTNDTVNSTADAPLNDIYRDRVIVTYMILKKWKRDS